MNNKLKSQMNSLESEFKKSLKNSDCPKGEILRVGYNRKAYTKSNGTKIHATHVDPSCIKDLGAPGKGVQLIDIEHPGALKAFGYHADISEDARHRALKKFLKHLSEKIGEHDAMLNLIHKLIAVKNLMHRTNPKDSEIFKKDQEWVSGLLDKWKVRHADNKKKKKAVGCPPGQIMRVGYNRKSYKRSDGSKVKSTHVDEGCIKDLGAPGKGPQIIPIASEHFLTEHGYHNIKDMTEAARHRALKKAIADMAEKKGSEHEAFLGVIHELTARRNILVRTSPEASEIFKKDQQWVSELLNKWKANHANNKKKKVSLIKKKK